MTLPATSILVDFDDDLDWDESFEDVSSAVDPVRTQVLVERGKDQARALAPPMVGKLDFILVNESRDYSAENSGSPVFGMVEPGKKVRIEIGAASNQTLITEPGEEPLTTEGNEEIILEQSVSQPFATGRTESFEDHSDYGDENVIVGCFGNLGFLKDRFGSSPVYQDIRTDEAINYLLDAAGWPAEDRVLQEGQTTLTWWWWPEGQDALTALLEIFFSEGPGASLYEDPSGNLVFESRYARLTQARSTTSQITLEATGAAGYISRGAKYDPRRKDVINQVNFTIREREVQLEQIIWELNTPFALSPGETRKFKVKSSDGSPFKDAVTPATNDGANEVQILTANSDAIASTGTIQLGFGGEQTPAQTSKTSAQSYAVNIHGDMSSIQTAMQQLSTVGLGNLAVSGSLLTGIIFTFGSGLALRPVDLISVSGNLTGSGIPSLNVHRSVEGRRHGIHLTSGSIASAVLSTDSGDVVTLTVTAGSGGAVVDSMRVRAKPIIVTREYQISHSGDEALQTKYGTRNYPYSVRAEIDPNTADSIGQMIVYLYENPRPMLTLPIAEIDSIIQAYQLACEISDRVTVVLPQIGINSDYFVEKITHSLDQFGVHTTLGLEKSWSDEFAEGFAIVGSWELGTHALAF